MTERLKDRYAGFILLSIGLFSWFIIIPFGIESDLGMTTVGPAFFPKFITLAVIILSILLVVKSFLHTRTAEKTGEEGKVEDDAEASKSHAKKWTGVWVFVTMIGYIYLSEIIGHLFSGMASMTLVMWLLGARKWYLYVILITTIIAIQYVFENILYISLP